MEKITRGEIVTYYVADRRLYFNADKSKIVEEGDREAAFLYATPGTHIPASDAEKYGLMKQSKAEADKAVKQESVPDKSIKNRGKK